MVGGHTDQPEGTATLQGGGIDMEVSQWWRSKKAGVRWAGVIKRDDGSWEVVVVANKSTNLDRYIQDGGGNGPGQPFHNEPITRVGKQVKVLTQRGGYDI